MSCFALKLALVVLFPLIVVIYGIVCSVYTIGWGFYYFFDGNNANHFDDREKQVVTPLQFPPLGSLPQFLTYSDFLRLPPAAMEYFSSIADQGTFINVSVGVIRPQTMLLVKSADLSRTILTDTIIFHKGPGYDIFRSVTPGHLPGLDGEKATRLRKVLVKAIHKSEQRVRFAKIMFRQTKCLFRSLKQSMVESGENVVEISEMLRKSALAVIGEAVFGTTFRIKEEFSSALSCVMMEWHNRVVEIIPFRLLFPSILLPRQRAVQKSLRYLKSTLQCLIDNMRHEANPDTECMLYSILQESKRCNPPLTSEEIFNIVFTILSMGHENVSTASSWSLAHVAENNHLIHQIHSEFVNYYDEHQIAKALTTNVAPLTLAIISETLRLNPSIPILSRQATQNISNLGGIFIRNYDNVELLVCPWILHRDKSIWGYDADRFNPNRWFHARSNDNYYCPFGLGARACPGAYFAKIEMAIVLAVASTEWKSFGIHGNRPEPSLKISLRPANGIHIVVN